MAELFYAGKVNAPDFPIGSDWLNTDRPISIRELRGKIVLLDFWTYCCINCLHMIPDLSRLERKFADELVVIGVHSAKFTTERETASIREAILRHGIAHPVVNDGDFRIWERYTVRAWPTFMLIDPDGKIIGGYSGEYPPGMMDALIEKIIAEFDALGKIDRRPIVFRAEREIARRSLLSFPGKIAADEDGRTLFIADSGHNRILAVALDDFRVSEVIGSGEEGLVDGDFDVARFRGPQGIAVDGEMLYVADTGNHAIRSIHLRRRSVTTIAGNGNQARDFNSPKPGTAVALNSPWDLVNANGALYIAMAGAHQIWKLDIEPPNAISESESALRPEPVPHAGSGREALVDGPLLSAALAQPSGITAGERLLYIADSETSAIRSVAIDPGGTVETIVGLGLFEYGDRDGVGDEARLQHPLGIHLRDGKLYVVDSYNHRIRIVDPVTRSSRAIIGTGTAGMRDGEAATAELNEPGGLAFAGGILYIADTNNHAIRMFDPSTGIVSTLAIRNPDRLWMPSAWDSPAKNFSSNENENSDGEGRFANAKSFDENEISVSERHFVNEKSFGGEEPCGGEKKLGGDLIACDPVEVAEGGGEVEIGVNLPEGYVINAAAPLHLRIVNRDSVAVPQSGIPDLLIDRPTFPFRIPLTFTRGETELLIDLTIYYCRDDREALCFFRSPRVVIPIRVGDAPGPTVIPLTIDLR